MLYKWIISNEIKCWSIIDCYMFRILSAHGKNKVIFPPTGITNTNKCAAE